MPEKRSQNHLGEAVAIVATVVIAIAIGIVLGGFHWGFLAVLILGTAGSIVMRLWSRQGGDTPPA